MSGSATKEAKVVVESTLTFLGCQFTIFAELQQKLEVGSLVSEVVPWVELELFFCLDEELLPDLLSDLDWLDLGSDLLLEDSEVRVSWVTSLYHSQYHALIA